MSFKKNCLLGIMIALGSFCIGSYMQKDVEASNKYKLGIGSNETLKVKGVTFKTRENKSPKYTYSLVMKKKKKTVVITNRSNCDYVTNGKTLYYVTEGKKLPDYEHMNTIYKYNIATGKRRKITSGKNYTVAGCNGKYLYYGRDENSDGIVLNAINLKTGKKKYMRSGVGEVLISGKYVVTSSNSGDVGNYPIYVFKTNGTGKKKVANGTPLEIKKKKLYYSRYNEYTNKIRIYKCSLNGKNKKAITGWITQLPNKYIK